MEICDIIFLCTHESQKQQTALNSSVSVATEELHLAMHSKEALKIFCRFPFIHNFFGAKIYPINVLNLEIFASCHISLNTSCSYYFFQGVQNCGYNSRAGTKQGWVLFRGQARHREQVGKYAITIMHMCTFFLWSWTINYHTINHLILYSLNIVAASTL